jgi:hypothetical protein
LRKFKDFSEFFEISLKSGLTSCRKDPGGGKAQPRPQGISSMRAILVGLISALSLVGCTFPSCFETCPLLDPAQCGCGPRVPCCAPRSYCGSPCSTPGYLPYYGSPSCDNSMGFQPTVAPVYSMAGMPAPQSAPPATAACAGNTGLTSPQGPTGQLTSF